MGTSLSFEMASFNSLALLVSLASCIFFAEVVEDFQHCMVRPVCYSETSRT